MAIWEWFYWDIMYKLTYSDGYHITVLYNRSILSSSCIRHCDVIIVCSDSVEMVRSVVGTGPASNNNESVWNKQYTYYVMFVCIDQKMLLYKYLVIWSFLCLFSSYLGVNESWQTSHVYFTFRCMVFLCRVTGSGSMNCLPHSPQHGNEPCQPCIPIIWISNRSFF